MTSQPTAMLRNPWFSKVSTLGTDTETLVGYAARGTDHPMVLFSTVDPERPKPLAALTLVSPFADTLIWERPDREQGAAHFQGLVNKDHVEYGLVITNLTDSMINFNIMKGSETVTGTNPGGLNEINELRAYESYKVECDQADNLALMIDSIGGTTVASAEAAAHHDPSKTQGTYYWLVVTPCTGKPAEDFKATEWRATNTFVMVEPNSTYRGDAMDVETVRNMLGDVPSGETMSADGGVVSAMTRGYGITVAPNHFGDARSDTRSQVRFVRTGSNDALDAYRERLAAAGSSVVTWGARSIGAAFAAAAPSAVSDAEAMAEERSLDMFQDDTLEPASVTKSASKHTVIQTSLAARTGNSGRRVAVRGYETGMQYDYEATSTPCVLGLSVAPKLEIASTGYAAALSELEQQMQAWAQRKVKDLLKTITVYKETTCVVCLEDNPDMVLYKCGHQCMHAACDPDKKLTACPFCRAVIAARIT